MLVVIYWPRIYGLDVLSGHLKQYCVKSLVLVVSLCLGLPGSPGDLPSADQHFIIPATSLRSVEEQSSLFVANSLTAPRVYKYLLRLLLIVSNVS